MGKGTQRINPTKIPAAPKMIAKMPVRFIADTIPPLDAAPIKDGSSSAAPSTSRSSRANSRPRARRVPARPRGPDVGGRDRYVPAASRRVGGERP
jgi:hypothetical protein